MITFVLRYIDFRLYRMNSQTPIETHPWAPWLPDGAKVLIMGTFPPGAHRWAMDFYYPNPTNDFWKMIGLIFLGDPFALYDKAARKYRLPDIKALMTEKKIALNDTGYRIRRLKGNASDKFLEIVEPVDLYGLLTQIPQCHTVATTGEKAADVVASITGTERPKMGEHVLTPDGSLDLWRMPSTSRAYPMALEKKAEYYRTLFEAAGIL